MNEFARKYQVEGDNWKDKILYAVASTSFLSGVAMAFTSFFMSGTISGEILGFIGECFTLTGGIFGITLYIRNKVSTAGTYIINSVKELVGNNESVLKNKTNENNGDNTMAEEPLENRR